MPQAAILFAAFVAVLVLVRRRAAVLPALLALALGNVALADTKLGLTTGPAHVGGGLQATNSSARGVFLAGAGVDTFSAGKTIKSTTGSTLAWAPGSTLAVVYFAFANPAMSFPAYPGEQIVGSNNTSSKGWRLVNQFNGVYAISAGNSNPIGLDSATAAQFTLGLHRMVLVWRASDSHILFAQNGSSLVDKGLLTQGSAPDSTCVTNIGLSSDATYLSLASGSVCAWAVIPSELSSANAAALTAIGTTTSRFSFIGSWPAGITPSFDFDAGRDWNGSATTITPHGSASVALTVTGSPTLTNYSERRIPTTDGMYFDSKLSVAGSGYTVRNAYARLRVSGVSSRNIGYDWYDNFNNFASQSGIGAYVSGIYFAQNQETFNISGTDDFVLPAGTNRTVDLWEGNEIFFSAGVPYPPTGVFVTALRIPVGASQVFPTGPPQKRLVFLADSIFSGFYPAAPFQNSVTAKVRADFPTTGTGGVTCWCWGGSELFYIGGTGAQRSTLATALASALDGTSTSYLWIQLSTNDYSNGAQWGTPAAPAFGTGYGDLLDKIHTASPSTHVYAQTPFPRVSPASEAAISGSTLGDYRTAIASACAARASYCTTVDGTAIYQNTTIYNSSTAPTGRYYTDGIHNDAAANGTGDIKAAIKSALSY